MYTINIGKFMEHDDRCLSASFGGSGIPCDNIPWDGTEHNPWDYKYENGEFVLDVIPIPEPNKEDEIADIESQMESLIARYRALKGE